MLSIVSKKRGKEISNTDNVLRLRRYCLGLRSIDELGFMDSGFGFFAALASVLKLDDESDSQIDKVAKIIIDMRRFMTLQEAFCGINFDSNPSRLYKINRPEHLLFEGKIEPHLFNNLSKKVFEPLTPEFFSNVEKYDSKTNSFPIKKNSDMISDEPILLDRVLSWLRKSCSIKRNTLADPDPRPFYNRVNFRKRSEFTCELHDYFLKNKTIDLVKIFNSNIIQTTQYNENENFGLVGITRKKISRDKNHVDPSKHGFQTCLYFLYHYELKEDKPLTEIYLDLNHFLPNLLEHNNFIKNILIESSQLCNPPGKEYYVQKILTRIPHTKKICVLFCVYFSKEIVYARNEYEKPCKDLYHFIENEINGKLMDNLRNNPTINFDKLVGAQWVKNNPKWEVIWNNDVTAYPLSFDKKGDYNVS